MSYCFLFIYVFVLFRQTGPVQFYSWFKWGPVIEHRKSFLPLNFGPPNQTLNLFVTVDVRCSHRCFHISSLPECESHILLIYHPSLVCLV